jgi:hypothetical protein
MIAVIVILESFRIIISISNRSGAQFRIIITAEAAATNYS